MIQVLRGIKLGKIPQKSIEVRKFLTELSIYSFKIIVGILVNITLIESK